MNEHIDMANKRNIKNKYTGYYNNSIKLKQ